MCPNSKSAARHHQSDFSTSSTWVAADVSNRSSFPSPNSTILATQKSETSPPTSANDSVCSTLTAIYHLPFIIYRSKPSPAHLLTCRRPTPDSDPPDPHCLMFTRIRHILEMIRFSHTLFALPFALL